MSCCHSTAPLPISSCNKHGNGIRELAPDVLGTVNAFFFEALAPTSIHLRNAYTVHHLHVDPYHVVIEISALNKSPWNNRPAKKGSSVSKLRKQIHTQPACDDMLKLRFLALVPAQLPSLGFPMYSEIWRYRGDPRDCQR